MIPLKDDNPTTRPPWLTLTLMALNLAVYVYQLTLSVQGEFLFIYEFGLVPAWLSGTASFAPDPSWPPRWITLFTSMFVHGGILHLAGNMLYLWIFGNNVEDALGPVRFLAFYLVGGLVAGLAHVLSDPGSELAMIGASGALAAVLGAYFLLYPHARVLVLIWLVFYVQLVRVPALVVLGIWFLLQVLKLGGPEVAWMAHIGGFVVGMLLINLFLPGRLRRRRP